MWTYDLIRNMECTGLCNTIPPDHIRFFSDLAFIRKTNVCN